MAASLFKTSEREIACPFASTQACHRQDEVGQTHRGVPLSPTAVGVPAGLPGLDVSRDKRGYWRRSS